MNARDKIDIGQAHRNGRGYLLDWGRVQEAVDLIRWTDVVNAVILECEDISDCLDNCGDEFLLIKTDTKVYIVPQYYVIDIPTDIQ